MYFDFLGGQFPWWWGFVVLVVGAVSALLGVMYALMEHDLKSLLAFHSVENIGIILIGIGAGMIFQTYGLKEFAALGCWPGSTTRSTTPCSRPAVSGGRVSAVCHAYAQYGGVWRPAPAHALDRGLLSHRSRVDCSAAPDQRLCE